VAEPESVIAEGVLHATQLLRRLWTAGRHSADEGQAPALSDVRRRLELFVGTIFPTIGDLGTAEPAAPPSLLERLARRGTSHLHASQALPSVSGGRVLLPGTLGLPPAASLSRYRLLALEQAARIDRGTMSGLPADDLLLRDLYLLAEAAAVDVTLGRLLPRLVPDLQVARREAIDQIRVTRRPSPQDLAMAAMTRLLLSADLSEPPSPFRITAVPGDSLRWARDQAMSMRRLPGPYRGLAPIPLWGLAASSIAAPASVTPLEMNATPMPPGRIRTLTRQPREADAPDEQDDPKPCTWMVRADDAQEKAEDPAGLQRPADQDKQADPGDLAEALAELPEARLVRTPEPVAEILAGANPPARSHGQTAEMGPAGISYPEWDWQLGRYRPRAAVVRERMAVGSAGPWLSDILRRHAALIRAVRRDFARLRPRRMALRRQPDGAELDVDAMVTAYGDRRRGVTADDRFHIDCRPVRRDAAIMLLVDTSASTDGWVSGNKRSIDVEKEALLIVGEALQALGDPHMIMAYASAGPLRVDVRILKRFEDRTAVEMHGRIAALEPDGFTRTGAALRHATACLMRRDARHRLLLLLSDGRPNDVDQYEGRYGIEDTRMAVTEARLLGVHIHCLTVDREAPRYAHRIFGRDFSVLSRVERLPVALTAILRDLLRG
jgi:nitric oxide reductase NorD protein